MARPEIVAYLKANLDKYPLDDLRERLKTDGVTDAEFDAALKEARPAPPRAAAKPRRLSAPLLGAGIGVLACVGVLIALSGRKSPEKSLSAVPESEGGFVGHAGYVVHLPKGYVALAEVKDPAKDWEVVHFCKAGTDPTNLLNEGLFGQLGIVRLEVQQSPLAGNLNAPDMLTRLVGERLQRRGDKFTIKNLSGSPMRGIQVTIEPPNAAVEAYVLGDKLVYVFFAGQDDEILRDIVSSLRDPHAEN